MRRWILALAASLIAMAAAAAQEGDATPTGYDGVFFKRQVILVSDLERALTLWRDVLGMELGRVTPLTDDAFSTAAFNIPAGARVRFANLSAGPNQVRTLGLVEVAGVDLPPREGPRTSTTVLNANGRYDAIRAALASLGLPLIAETELATPTQGTGEEMAFRDWDGNVIVVYQLPNADAPNRN